METFYEEETINYARVSGTVSKLLEAMASQFHFQMSNNSEMQYKVTVFDSHTVPDIKLSDYLSRITSMAKCTFRDVIASLVFIDKLINYEAISGISFYNIHRLLAVSLMLSTKFFEDLPYSNKKWSKIVGLSLRELNLAEREFLQALNFDMNIELETLQGWSEAVANFETESPVNERQESCELNYQVDQNCSEMDTAPMEATDSPIEL